MLGLISFVVLAPATTHSRTINHISSKDSSLKAQEKSPGLVSTAKTRMLRVGDSWTYEVTTRYPYMESWNGFSNRWEIGEGSAPHRHRNLDFHGSFSVKVVQIAEGDGPTKLALKKNLKFSRKDKDVDQTWLVYFNQDANTGKITSLKKDTATDEPVEVGCLIPGSWSDGYSYESIALYGVRPKFNSSINSLDIEESESFACVVSETEKVRVKAGHFDAWKVSRVSNLSPLYSDNVWFSPDIGYFLKLQSSMPTGNLQFPKCIEIIELASTTVKSS